MRSKATKKMAKKEVKARKRDDEETKEEMKRIKAVGKAVKKATRKDKGKLGELVESIQNSNPTKEKYIVVNVEFYGSPTRHFIVTPFNKEKSLIS